MRFGERWAVSGFTLMGAAWVASGLAGLAMDGRGAGEVGSPRWYVIEGLHGAGEAGLVVGLLALGSVIGARSALPRGGHFGLLASSWGTGLVLVSTIAVLATAAPGPVIGSIFGLGMLGWLVGFPLLGVALMRTSLLSSVVGWLLLAFAPLAIGLFLVLEAYTVGGVAVGVLWLAVAWLIRVPARATAARPDPAA
jgi:hypothetical protein